MAKLTTDQIIKKFLTVKLNSGVTEFPSHIIETQLPSWGMAMFSIMHSPGTYSRRFRELVEKKEVIVEELIGILESKEKWWTLKEVK